MMRMRLALQPHAMLVSILFFVSNMCIFSTHYAQVDAAKVVTLGDSYSSGTGAHIFLSGYDQILGASATFKDLLEDVTTDYEFTSAPFLPFCTRETDATPGARLAKEQGLDSEMGACAGAKIPNLYDQINYLNARFPDEYANQWEGSTILLTLGLNDFLSIGGDMWGMVLFRCIIESDCSPNPDYQVGNQEQIKTDLMAVLSFLAAEASRATIRVFGYGKLFQRNNTTADDNGNANTIGGIVPCGAFGISDTEADFLDEDYFGLINTISREVIAEIQTTAPVPNVILDIEFIDVTTYLTVGSCDSNSDGWHLHGFGSFYPAAYHPTQLGYDQYYNALEDNLSSPSR